MDVTLACRAAVWRRKSSRGRWYGVEGAGAADEAVRKGVPHSVWPPAMLAADRTPGIEASGGLKEMRQEYRVPEITAWNESFCRIMQNELGHQNLEGVEHLLESERMVRRLNGQRSGL